MPRFETVEKGVRRFWEVAVEGTTVTTRFGRVGGEPETSTRDLGSSSDAWLLAAQLSATKQKKGWTRVEDAAAEPGTADGVEAREPALEAAIAANPDDPKAWLVYGDWLQSCGDPLGELV